MCFLDLHTDAHNQQVHLLCWAINPLVLLCLFKMKVDYMFRIVYKTQDHIPSQLYTCHIYVFSV